MVSSAGDARWRAGRCAGWVRGRAARLVNSAISLLQRLTTSVDNVMHCFQSGSAHTLRSTQSAGGRPQPSSAIA